MSNSGYLQRWKQGFKLMFHFLLPDRLLRYFPPAFVMRDPAVSLLNRARKRGDTCGVVVLHLEGFHKMIMAYPSGSIYQLQREIRKLIMNLVPRLYGESNLIAATQLQDELYCLYIRSSNSALFFEELTAKSMAMHREMESRLRQLDYPDLASYLRVQSGVHIIDTQIEDTALAAKAACHYALAVATKKLPSHFSPARQELLRIIEQEDLTVLAQPIILLTDGEIFGWEILTRGPQQSPFHSPDQLFELAYQADLLSRLEFLIFRKTFEKIATSNIREQVFVNVTAVTLCHPLFDRKVMELLEDYPEVQPQRIVFELTERHFIRDFNHTAAVMRKYRELGFRFAVDDAGAGYSSLQTISELIPDIIKIDKSVIQNIDQIAVKESLLKALITFAQNINCKVIAEGVERAEEADVLFKNDVHLGQGFYFARPTPLLFSYEDTELEHLRNNIRSLRGLAEKVRPEFGV